MSLQSKIQVRSPPATFTPAKKVGVLYDASQPSKDALAWGIKSLLQPQDLIVLINVRPMAFNHSDLEYDMPFSITEEEMREQEQIIANSSTELLNECVKQLSAKGFESEAISLCGEARKELEDYINQSDLAFVVVGKRGYGSVSGLLLGSVSDHLVHHLKIPVMIYS